MTLDSLNQTDHPLKILIISRPFTHQGGVRTSLEYQFVFSDPHRVQYAHVGIGKSYPGSPFWKRGFEYGASIFKVLAGIRRHKPDLIQINPSLVKRSIPLHFLFIQVIKMVTQRPLLVYFRGWDQSIGEQIAQQSKRGKRLIHTIKQADHCIVLAQAFKEQLTAGGIAPEKITILPEMVDTRQFTNETPHTARPDMPLNIFFISRLIRDKGVFELLDAADWLHRTHPQLPFSMVLAGNGDALEDLQTAVQESQLAEIVSLPGKMIGAEKLAAFMQADIFAFPSQHSEGFPIAVLEAMAAGLPLIYTPQGALAENLNAENGICLEVENLNGERIGQAILALAQDPARRARMAAANRQAVQTNYDARMVVARLEEIFEQIVKGKDA